MESLKFSKQINESISTLQKRVGKLTELNNQPRLNIYNLVNYKKDQLEGNYSYFAWYPWSMGF